jgi:type I restriction enzyme S subunit
MTTGTLKALTIPLPPMALQEGFACIVEHHECLRATRREALRQAEHFFQPLLNRVFNVGF